MELLAIFAISMLSFFAACTSVRTVVWLNDVTKRFLISWLRKNFIYTVVRSRMRGSYNMTVLGTSIVLLYVSANVFFLLFQAATDLDVADSAKVLFCVNLIPLCIGNRCNRLTDKILHVRLGELNVVHSWLGRGCVMHGLVHGVIKLIHAEHRFTPLNILVLYIDTKTRQMLTISSL